MSTPSLSGEHALLLYKLYEVKRQGNTAAMACRWYFSRKKIEENSPSRRDGIDLKKESKFRKSYCNFVQDLGMRIKVPQLAIATATMFCHRFCLRQSHGKHDRLKIGTACLFLALKVEETPRPLRDIVAVSYEIIHRKDTETVRRILMQEWVYQEQKVQILKAEKLVLETLDFDISVNHPYKTLVDAIRKFKVDNQSALGQIAWNFVNDGLRTSLCLQLKPHQIAAGAFFLAFKFLKIKLPSDGHRAWWQEFGVTPSQLEEISNQMLEFYDQPSAPRASKAKVHNHLAHPKASETQNSHNTDSERHKIHQQEQEKLEGRMGTLKQKDGQPPPAAVKRMIEDKVEVALEKRRKSGPD